MLVDIYVIIGITHDNVKISLYNAIVKDVKFVL